MKTEESEQTFKPKPFLRTKTIVLYVILPNLLLICLSFLCGYFLAELESDGEIKANDSFLKQEKIDDQLEPSVLTSLIDKTYQCTNQFYRYMKTDNETLDDMEVEKLCRNTTIAIADEYVKRMENIPSGGGLSFNWIKCHSSDSDTSGFSETEIFERNVRDAFDKDYREKVAAEISEGSDFNASEIYDAHRSALLSTTGHQNCTSNAAGGALFWFTIMTTIGYGNTAPTTTGGRTMVLTLGFVSILIFTSVLGIAGTVSLAIFDDFVIHRLKSTRLTCGYTATFFWFVVLVVWVLCFGVILQSNAVRNEGKPNTLYFDMFWFAYITITTVGFGDYYIQHETFNIGRMFFLLFAALIGFVFLANFLLKFADAIKSTLRYDQDSMSLEYQLKMMREREVITM